MGRTGSGTAANHRSVLCSCPPIRAQYYLVLGVQVRVAAQPPQIHRDRGIEPVGDLACGAHLLAAGLHVDVLILVLD